ncbi:MAG: hypothetical protein AAFQ99_04675 [Pseudomonadota bacterium]
MAQAAARASSNNQEAGRRKRHAVLAWLGRWHVTTVRQLLEVADTSSKNFLYAMQKRGLIRKLDQEHLADTVMMLKPLGKALAAELVPEAAYYNTDVSKVNHATLRHAVACQDLVLANRHRLRQATPEAFLRVTGSAGEKRPDLLIEHHEDVTTAVEVELTQKREDDIYRGYVAYLRRLHDRAVSQVVYAFRPMAMRDRYQRAIEAATWPLYERSPQGRWVRLRDVKGREQRLRRDDVPALLDRFNFQLMTDRVPTPTSFERPSLNLGPTPTRTKIRITAADWKAVDPEVEPGQIIYVTPKQLFEPEAVAGRFDYRDDEGRRYAHIKTVKGQWRRIVLASEAGHHETLTKEEFESLGLEYLGSR